MKARLALALVLCVAAAAIFAPVKAEEDAAAQFDEDDVSAGEIVKPLSRELKEVEGNADADEGQVETAGTELQQDPSSHMMRDLKRYYYYYYGKYDPYRKYYGKKGRRLQGYPYGKKYYYGKYNPYRKYYWKKGRRLQGYYYGKKYYYYGKKYSPYKKYYGKKGRRLNGNGDGELEVDVELE